MTAYYVDATTGNDSDTGLSEELAWQTVAKVNTVTFDPDDFIYFKRGEQWNSAVSLSMNGSGTEGHPITWSAYGSGAAPRIDNTTGEINADIKGSWIVVENFHFYQGDYAGIRTAIGVENNIIQDCEFSSCGYSIWLRGDNNRVTRCYIHDVVNYTGGDGATGVVMQNVAGCEVDHNIFSCSTGSNGSDIETFADAGSVSNANIHHNYSVDGWVFAEVGGLNGSSFVDNVYHHNLLINPRKVWMVHMAGTYSSTVTGMLFDHNTVIQETDIGAFDWLWDFYPGSSPSPSNVSARNNIVISATDVARPGETGFGHTYNMYLLSGGAVLNFSLGTGESEDDPEMLDQGGYDMHLGSGSPAIEAGLNLGYLTDYDGIPLGRGTNSDIGCYETLKGGPRDI